MRVEYSLQPGDYASFVRFHYRERRRASPSLRFLVPVLWTFLALPGLLSGRAVAFNVFTISLSIVWILIFPAFYRWFMTRLMQRQAAEEGLCRGSIGPQVLEVGPDGLVMTDAHSRTELQWSGVERVVDSRDHIFIYQGPNEAAMIPKRELKPEQAAALFQAIELHFDNAAA